MKSLCLFVSYTETHHGSDLPLIFELQRFFDEVLVLTNLKPKEETFSYLVLPNAGYDFGFFYRALLQLDLSDVRVLGLVNNSQILTRGGSLDGFFSWFESIEATFCGMTDSYEAPKGVVPNRSYHVQSSFLVTKGKAVPLVADFFREVDFERFFRIKNPKKLRQAIINECEIGLSQYMLQHGQELAAWFSAEKFNPRHGQPLQTNMHVVLWEELILAGYPLMKRKLLNGDWDKFSKNTERRFKYIDRSATGDSVLESHVKGLGTQGINRHMKRSKGILGRIAGIFGKLLSGLRNPAASKVVERKEQKEER